ncbi:co-chaperone GroES [Escherichia phage UE-S1]|nr:co-chaperone GroES [Escherichia phage UE-S1]
MQILEDTDMKIKMINDYVLVRQIEAQNKSSGGIILGNVEPPCIGMVISVGPGKVLPNGQLAEHDIKEGDMVVFGRSSLNTPLTEDLGGGEDTYYVMKIEEIFGKKNG